MARRSKWNSSEDDFGPGHVRIVEPAPDWMQNNLTAPSPVRRRSDDEGSNDSSVSASTATASPAKPASGRLDGKVIAIIGAGAMGGALCRGMVNSRVVRPSQVLVSDPHTAHVDELVKLTGVESADSNVSAAAQADIILLAVKPYNVDPVLDEISPSLKRDGDAPLVICIAAGVPTSRLEHLLEHRGIGETPVIRAMPNTPAQVGKGACAYCKGKYAAPIHMAQAASIFRSVGIAVETSESMMDAVTALSGSGPAYIYLMIEALVDGGVRAGLPRDIASQLASQTVLGAAQMVIETGKHPAQLRDMVTTPAGTTIEAIASLEHSGLRAALIDAIGKAAARSRELA